VLAGKIPACKWVRLACQRQLDDLARPSSNDWLWRFDRKKASRVCAFIELLPHIKGKWATPQIRLEPWQIFLLTTVFGWVGPDGNRRFRTVYIEVPRKNAKSTLTSGVALNCLCEDEPGAEVYSAATKKDQAKIVWGDARRMVQRTPGLRRRFGVETHAHDISVEDRAAKFIPLSSDEDGLDGLNIHFAAIDEVHAHKTRTVWDALDSGTGARSQPLIWAITTAGFNREGICYEQRTYVTRLLDRSREDERYFGIIYSIDLEEKDEAGNVIPGDDWTTEQAWRKANPNYGVSVRSEDIAALCRKAQASAQSQNNFLTKRLNVWVSSETAWFNMAAWRKCRREVTLEEFEGQPCWLGNDLSSKTDATSKARVFRREEKDGAHYYVFGTHYLPEEVVEEGLNTNCSHYAGWAREDRIVLTDGAAVDLDKVEDDIREDLRRFDVQAVAYDPWNAAQMAGHLLAEGAPMVENRMGVQTMSEPMKTLDALIVSQRIHHDGDPVLTWMLSNVVGHLDAKSNVYPRKERPENKIDGAVALIMALGRAIVSKDSAGKEIEVW
jgi:phage terminase large subunit-like protein